MLKPELEIHLLKGFCALKFGDSVARAEALFGMPEESQTLDDSILETSSFVMHYWDYGFSLFFDNHKNKAFSSVEADNPDTLLFGQKISSIKEPTLIELMAANGYKLSETEKHEWGEKRLSFDEAGLDCYFENGKLISVNFGILTPNEGFAYFPN